MFPGEPREIPGIGGKHVLLDSRDVSASTTRPLAQLLAGGGSHCRVERSPASLEQRLEAVQFVVINWFCIAGWGEVRGAEIRGRVAGKPLNYGQGTYIVWSLEVDAGCLEHAGIMGAIIQESLQG
jgi:hypothetical protein